MPEQVQVRAARRGPEYKCKGQASVTEVQVQQPRLLQNSEWKIETRLTSATGHCSTQGVAAIGEAEMVGPSLPALCPDCSQSLGVGRPSRWPQVLSLPVGVRGQ